MYCGLYMKSRARPDEKESIVVLMYLAFSLSVSIVNRLCEGESQTISKDRKNIYPPVIKELHIPTQLLTNLLKEAFPEEQ